MINKSTLETHFGNIKKSNFIELATQWQSEKNWKQKSQHIALELLDYLDVNNLTQKAFAQMMGVSPQAINKWLKGQENFTLETISKLEAVMKRNLIEIISTPTHTEMVMEEFDGVKEKYSWTNLPQQSNYKMAKVVAIRSTYDAKLKGY